MISQLLSYWRHGRVGIGTEEGSQGGLLFSSTGVYAFGGLIRVENEEVLAREVDIQANNIWDLFVDWELEDPPDALGSTHKP